MAKSKKKPDMTLELEELEAKIKRLRVEYEQYFMRVLKREPLFVRSQVERTITFYSLQHITNTSAKFKFRNLADQYNAYKMYWNRTLKQIENGTFRRKGEGSEGGLAPKTTVATSTAAMRPVPRPANGNGETAMKELFTNYIDAKKELNENTDNITYDVLKKAVMKQREMAEKKFGTDDFDLAVRSQGGKVKIVLKKRAREA